MDETAETKAVGRYGKKTVKGVRQTPVSCAGAVRARHRQRRNPLCIDPKPDGSQDTRGGLPWQAEPQPSSAVVSAASSEQTALAPFPPDGENCVSLRCSYSPNRKRFAGLRFG